MKIKMIALVIATMLIFAAVACGNPAPAASSAPAQTAAEEPKAAEPAKAEEPAAEAPEAPEAPAEEAAPQTDWTEFDGWLDEDWNAKEIAYQFTGEWELAEYNIFNQFCINLYTDGFAIVDQRNTGSCSSYLQYGYWSEEKTEDGNEIAFDTLYVTNVDGSLIAHEYSYTLYEESDGNYSFGYTFGIAPGAYFREAPVVGGKAVTYATMDDFHAAVDQITETNRFVSTEADENGLTLRISTFSNGTAVANLIHPDYDVINHKDGALKADYDAAGNATYTLVIEDVEIPLATNEDGSFQDFEFTYDADLMGNAIHLVSTVTPTEVPAEPAA